MKEIVEKLFNEGVRMERVIYIAGMLGNGESISDSLSDFLSEDEEEFLLVFPDAPQWLLDELNDRLFRGEAFKDYVMKNGKLGFVIEFSTPVRTKLGEKTSSYSWASVYTRWIYADTMDKAIDLGIEWAKQTPKQEAD